MSIGIWQIGLIILVIVLLFGAGKGPAHHCAYVTPGGGLIHCYREARVVVEQGFSPWWRAKLRHAFRLPGIED